MWRDFWTNACIGLPRSARTRPRSSRQAPAWRGRDERSAAVLVRARLSGRNVPLERAHVLKLTRIERIQALLPVLDLDRLEDHLDLLQDVAFLGGRLVHLGDEGFGHDDGEEGLPSLVARGLAHLQLDLLERLPGADVGED